MRAKSLNTGNERKGVILLVVLAMLTLLTVLGITFVLYADSSEATARINLESEKIYQPQYTEKELLQHAIGQLVFDVEDDVMGQQSGMRGHSLARDMYGYRYSGQPFSMGSPSFAGTGLGLNDRPFRGTGRLENDKKFINFTTFNMGSNPELIRDPERYGNRNPNSIAAQPNAYVGGFNPPYTYPDLNHVFLAKLDSNGQVTEPSFVRKEALDIPSTDLNPPLGQLDPQTGQFVFSNPYWTNDEGKYRILRPRSKEHPLFPAPADGYGDVRNLPWGTHNDAVWIDLGVEPKTAPNGRKYKPLFAFTVLDLDGRANLNAHGNIHGRDQAGNPNQTHASRDGLGPWEVNLSRILANPAPVFLGANGVAGRHNQNGTLSGTYLPQNLWQASPHHTHGPLDGNGGMDVPGQANPYQQLGLPGSPLGSATSPFGRFIAQVYGGMGLSETTPFHEVAFHPYFPSPGNKLFDHSHLCLLMGRSLRSSTAWQNSELVRLGLFAPDPFASISSRDSNYDRLTTMSWDLDRPGMVPYLNDRLTQTLGLQPIATWTPVLPSAGYTPFNPQQDYPAQLGTGFPQLPQSAPQNSQLVATGPNSEFDPLVQSTLAFAKRLNLRRYMTQFPPVDPTTGLYTDPSNTQQAPRAMAERQQFAQDIFNHLALAAGVLKPGDTDFPNPIQNPQLLQDPRYLATKWIAQLAANMVDYIDNDDVLTVFPWNNGQFADAVLGVELARLTLNELYVQVENDPADNGQNKSKKEFKAKVYVELLNPLLQNNGSADDHSAVLKAGNQNVHILELVKASAIAPVRDISQKQGFIGQDHANNPNNPGALIGQTSWDFPAKVGPADEQFGAISPAGDGKGLSTGFVVVGPKPENQTSDLTNPRWTTPAQGPDGDIIHKDLGFLIPKDTQKLDTLTQQDLPMVLLRRLAVQGMLHQPDPAQPGYNPYITIDMSQITPQMLAENDARKIIDDPNKGANQQNTNPNKVDIANRKAYGRSQPYFGIPASVFIGQQAMQAYGTLIPQDPQTPASGGPKCTFWRHNTRSDTAPAGYIAAISYPPAMNSETFETPRFRPHLDRWPSTIGEILTVPTCRAHEVVMLNDHRASYCAGWHDPTTRLYRFLEMAQAGNVRNLMDSTNGQPIAVGAEGGRIPGKVNVNTMTYEVFKALCDAQQTTNRFSDQQVDQIYEQLQANRPYWGFGMGEFSDPNGDSLSKTKRGMNQTLLRRHPGGVPSFNPADGNANDPTDLINLMLDAQNANNNGGQPPAVIGTSRFGMGGAMDLPPSVRQELLSKIIGNTTSRSNCFAVWLTVGFFEVVSDQGNPTTAAPKYILGKEMQPRTRRRMFSLVDRTMLEAWRVQLVAGSGVVPNTNVDPMSGQLTSPVAFQLSQLSYNGPSGPINLAAGPVFQSSTGKSYPIAPGSVLTFDPNTMYEETVEVVDLGTGTLGVVLHRPHGVNGPVTISSRGNPGPIPRENIDLDDLKNFGLIPYFQVLE
jgi:hypothetical protein